MKIAEFDELDDIALINEFNGISFANLAELALVTPRYYRIIVDNFIIPNYHFNQTKVEIGLYHNVSSLSYSSHGRFSETRDINFILLALKAFCPLFSHLTIQSHGFPYISGYTQKIVENVNKYCGDVPQTINIALSTEKQQIFTFQNASNVILHQPTHNNVNVINQMFPQMTKLVLYTEESYSLDGNFVNLQHFHFQQKSNGLFDMKTFGKFNRQIQSMKVTFDWDLHFLHQLNEIFPDLESLELVPLYNTGVMTKMSRFFKQMISKPVDTIRFRSVTTFTFDIHYLYFRYTNILKTKYHYDISGEDWAKNRLAALKFDQLKSFKLITKSTNFVNEQIDLVAQNTDLSSVDLTSIELTYEQMERLVRALPKLNKVTLECKSTETIENIVRVMEASNLEIVSVHVPLKSRDEFLEKFPSRLVDGWMHDRDNEHLKDQLTFIRK